MSEPTRAELVHRTVFWSQIAEDATGRADAARASLAELAVAEYKRDGVVPTWRIPGVGTVPLAISKPKVVVTDERAFLYWVADQFPTEIEEITRVRSTFTSALCKALAEAGQDPPCTAEGEVIPGLAYLPGGQPRGVSIRATDEAKAAAADLARAVLDSLTPAGTAPMPDMGGAP